MFKNFCHCNAAISDLYDGKSKSKIAVTFFPNSHGWLDNNRKKETQIETGTGQHNHHSKSENGAVKMAKFL